MRFLPALTIAAAAVGTTVALAPVASADDVDFNAVQDRTSYFVPFTDVARIVNETGPVIVSPFGTSHKIECRGDGHYAQIHDCVQYDSNNAPRALTHVPNPIRDVWVLI